MNSLQSVSSGREFLLQPQRPYRPAAYRSNFADYDTSGFDECCPTVSECQYPAGKFAGATMPDHGDLWSMAWEYNVRYGELLFEAKGKSLPYIFRKRARLEGNAIVLRYEIASIGSQEFAFLWSAHPLFAVEPGCRIVLPDEVSRLFVNWSHDGRLGEFGDSCGWPIACTRKGVEVDLAQVASANARTAEKLFTSRLSKGRCAILYPGGDESIALHFDPLRVPYLGLWICQGGWPSPENGHFTVALEPCNGRPDSLREAIQRNECDVLKPGQKKSWEIRIEVSP